MKIRKYLGIKKKINLTKEVKDVYTEYYLTDEEDTNK